MAGFFEEFSKLSPFCRKWTISNLSQKGVNNSLYEKILLGLLKDKSGKMFDLWLLALKISTFCDDFTDIAHFSKNMDLLQALWQKCLFLELNRLSKSLK